MSSSVTLSGGLSISVTSDHMMINGTRYRLPPDAKGGMTFDKDSHISVGGYSLADIARFNSDDSKEKHNSVHVLLTLEDGTKVDLSTASVSTLVVNGNVSGSVHAGTNCYVLGDVSRDASSQSGDVFVAGNVGHNAESMSGNVNAAVVMGNASTMSGNATGNDVSRSSKEALRAGIEKEQTALRNARRVEDDTRRAIEASMKAAEASLQKPQGSPKKTKRLAGSKHRLDEPVLVPSAPTPPGGPASASGSSSPVPEETSPQRKRARAQ